MWYTKCISTLMAVLLLLTVSACGQAGTVESKDDRTSDSNPTESDVTEMELDLLNDPDSDIYYLERGIDPKTKAKKYHPSICLILNGDQYYFWGEGEDYDFMVQYLGSESGTWELVPFSDREDNTVYYVDNFTVNLYLENTIIITSSPLTSHNYTFSKK